jgi:hypothetical protein
MEFAGGLLFWMKRKYRSTLWAPPSEHISLQMCRSFYVLSAFYRYGCLPDGWTVLCKARVDGVAVTIPKTVCRCFWTNSSGRFESSRRRSPWKVARFPVPREAGSLYPKSACRLHNMDGQIRRRPRSSVSRVRIDRFHCRCATRLQG